MNSRVTSTKYLLEQLYTLKWDKPTTIKDILKKLYIEDGMTILEISKKLRVSQGTVSNWLKEYGIPARSWGFSKE